MKPWANVGERVLPRRWGVGGGQRSRWVSPGVGADTWGGYSWGGGGRGAGGHEEPPSCRALPTRPADRQAPGRKEKGERTGGRDAERGQRRVDSGRI